MEVNTKSILGTIAIPLIIAGGYYLFFSGETGTKIVCADHLESAHALVDELYPSMSGVGFDEYFFSPKLETCVAGLVHAEVVPGEGKAQTLYLIVDALNGGKEIFGRLGTRYYAPNGKHETTITETDESYYLEYWAKIAELQR